FLFIPLSNVNLVSALLGELLIEDHTTRTAVILMAKRSYNVAAGHHIGHQGLDRDFHRLTRTSVNAIGSFPSVRFEPPDLTRNTRLHGQTFLSLRHVSEPQDSREGSEGNALNHAIRSQAYLEATHIERECPGDRYLDWFHYNQIRHHRDIRQHIAKGQLRMGSAPSA